MRSVHGRRLKIGLWDISRAHFYGTPKRRIYIEIPSEDRRSKGGKSCGLLEKSMAGQGPKMTQNKHEWQLQLALLPNAQDRVAEAEDREDEMCLDENM